MSIDYSWTHYLNQWGVQHKALTTFLGNDLVYFFIAIAGLWVASRELPGLIHNKFAMKYTFQKFSQIALRFVIPLVIAVAISELISGLIGRDRPFVSENGITLVFPHDPDGGMPSHHILFMVAIATCIAASNRILGIALILLALISGAARVAAGIHFPSDIAVGAILGFGIVTLYLFLISKFDFFKRFGSFD